MARNTRLLESFREAYGNLDLLPLLGPDELDKFQVDYGVEVLEDLQQLVEDSASGDSKIIFTGHRGCGKSTLLAQFARQCRDRYFVVFFSISDTIEMSDVNHINILFAIAVNLMYEVEKNQVKINEPTKKELDRWFAQKARPETEQLGAEVAAGFNLFQTIKGKLQADASIREEIKHEFKNKVSDLIAKLNEIAAAIELATKKEVIVIIDDLDKIDLGLVSNIYRDNIKALLGCNFRIIFTIQIAAYRNKDIKPIIDTETNGDVVTMPVSKIFDKGANRLQNPVPIAETQELLRLILAKRIPEKLLKADMADKIALYSGGVMRELIRIARECCRICLRSLRRSPRLEELAIDDAVLEEAVERIQDDFASNLSNRDYEILQKVYKENWPDDPNQPEFLKLLNGVHIIEYQRPSWYDLNPMVEELLRKRDLI
ncbi:MAG: ATP-binding protein [Oscillatoria sp. SIO1A7]|nr:ATP-binding protein [Oscillatoria sp. SIO1A7]